MNFLDALTQHRIVAILRGRQPELVQTAASALIDEGIQLIEVTFTVPEAASIIRHLKAEHPSAIVGSGTVTCQRDIDASLEAGADFMVSPGASPDLIARMASSGIAWLPGVLSPSEAMAATEAGAEAVKLFPASAHGPSFLTQLRAPLPSLNVVPSGGIGIGDITAWMKAGATAIGLGSLATPEMIAKQQWEPIRAQAHQALQAAAETAN